MTALANAAHRRPWHVAALGAAGATGTAAGTVGWSLPAPVWLHLVASLLAAGTVLGVAAAGRLAVRSVSTNAVRMVLAFTAVAGLTVVPSSSPDHIPGLTAAEIVSVLATPVTTDARTSGGDGSLVSRASLGKEGRAFLDQGPRPDGAVRAYVGVGARADERERVLLAVREWVRLGGLQRSTVLIAIPTGSGWVNTPAVHAAEDQAGGDIATLVVQYAARPSWLELLLDRGRATRVATAVVDAVQDVLAQVPSARRPHVVLFGESLGADAAAQVTGPGVAACLAAGRPGEQLTGGTPTSCTDVANGDDPVAAWDPDLLWNPRGTVGWLPVASFWRTSAELLVALDQGVGHGHSYLGSVADEWAAIWPVGTLADRG